MKRALLWVPFAAVLSCRPFPVAVVNHSGETVEIRAMCTEHFQEGRDSGQTHLFLLAPGDSLHCGFATAGLGDEIPFGAFPFSKEATASPPAARCRYSIFLKETAGLPRHPLPPGYP